MASLRRHLTLGTLALAVASACDTETTSRASDELSAAEEVMPADAPGKPEPEQASAKGVPVGRMAQALGARSKKHAADLVPDDASFEGELDEGKRSDHLLVLKSIYCYRLLGVGGPEVGDLDLALFDPDGVEVQRDLGEDAFPVLGQPVNLCPPQPGAYRLQVSMYEGHGPYVVGVFHTP